MSVLHHCYQAYSEIASSCTYYIILGRKKKKYTINLQFELEQFVHLIGIKHLKDLPFLMGNNHGTIIKKIKNHEITMKDLEKSQYFCNGHFDIGARIKCVAKLDEFLQSENLVIDYLDNAPPESSIRADWLIQGSLDEERCNLFLVRKKQKQTSGDRSNGNYICSSMFPCRGVFYNHCGKNMTVLLKQKNSTVGGTSTILHHHPSYILENS